MRNLDNQRQWGHLDFTISVIVGFSLLWGLAAAWEYCLRGGSAFDRNIAVTCGASVALCIILRPNHMKIFGGALGVIAGIAMEKYLFNPSETRALDPDDNDVPLAGLLGGLNALRKHYRERKLRETEGLRRS